MSDRIWGWIGAAWIAACLLLGGASAAGAAGNAVLQIGAVLLIVLLAWSGRAGAGLPTGARALLAIAAAYLIWLILSLVPLPAGLWESLPGRAAAAESLRLLGAEPAAMPLSLAPRKTLDSMLWLLPPAAAFFLVLRLPSRQRRLVAMAVIALALVSIVLGAFQLMGGESSSLRLYEITNPNFPVGFFANKNHLATLLLCTFPLAAALAGRSAGGRERARRHSAHIVYGAIAAFLLIGIAINGSLAGYMLLLPALAASFLVYRRETAAGTPRGAMVGLGVLTAGFVAAAAFGPISSESLSGKFTADPASRQVLTARTIEAAGDHFPAGSGLGSFQEVYRTYEDPAEASRAFANHAHNDYAEIALELGLPGILLVLAFLFWWARRGLAAWQGEFSGAAMARAASVAIGVVLFHSLVDYPIRTSAIAALFTAACAMLLQPPISEAQPRRPREGEAGEGGARHLQAD